MVKVIATSDLHGHLPVIDECDLLIVAGDVCPDYDIWNQDLNSQKQLEWLEDEFADWLHEAPAKKIVGVAGNHDFVFEIMPQDVEALYLRWDYLKGTAIDYEGLTIFGSPYVPNLANWAFYKPDSAFYTHWELIPDNVDILVTHGPPFGYGDVVGPKYGGPKHVGEKTLEHFLYKKTPTVQFVGHIHEANGHYDHEAVEMGIYNVSLVDIEYEPVNEPVALALGE